MGAAAAQGSVNAGPWTPSNFTVSAIANALTPTPPAVDMVGGNCTANTDTGSFTCDDGTLGMLEDGGQPTVPFVSITLPGAGGPAVVWAMSSLTIESSSALSVQGVKPAIFYVTGNVQIAAAVVATAGAQTGGIGAGR